MIVKSKKVVQFVCATILFVLTGCAAPFTGVSNSSSGVNFLHTAPPRLTAAARRPVQTETSTPAVTSVPTLEPAATATATEHPTSFPTPSPIPTKAAIAARTSTAAPIRTPAAAGAPSNFAGPPNPKPAASCGATLIQTYAALSVNGASADRQAAQHADLNLGLRGWVETDGLRALLSLGGPADVGAPQLMSLFAPRRMPEIAAAYAVYNWDFGAARRTVPLLIPAVSMLGLATASGESIYLPSAGYAIGEGQNALVLYAAPTRITLKYTRDDNVVNGYTLHVENICVNPQLLALYQSLDGAGRRQLPGLHNGQYIGSSAGGRILVGIQDSGAWMDPRARKDWWQQP